MVNKINNMQPQITRSRKSFEKTINSRINIEFAIASSISIKSSWFIEDKTPPYP